MGLSIPSDECRRLRLWKISTASNLKTTAGRTEKQPRMPPTVWGAIDRGIVVAKEAWIRHGRSQPTSPRRAERSEPDLML